MIGEADDNGVKSVKLTRQASDRLGIETVEVRESSMTPPSPGNAPTAGSSATPSNSPTAGNSPTPGSQTANVMTVVPYSAVLYTPDGTTWVYTVPKALTQIRQKVVVATVGGADGTEAFLSEGPPVGTTVVTVGVMELYGAELGVGK
ncbi:hypothetical protein [Micromonospora sp. DT47]|uniref:hypothetical protein n=1 Tax=Micromonospora sp. DT47 TaxID=3393431 RepID=UPI003CEA5C76